MPFSCHAAPEEPRPKNVHVVLCRTLTNGRSEMLTAMFDGDLPVSRTAEGRAFIDRDGERFGAVLSFLRTGDTTELPVSGSELAKVLAEAEFYQARRCLLITVPHHSLPAMLELCDETTMYHDDRAHCSIDEPLTVVYLWGNRWSTWSMSSASVLGWSCTKLPLMLWPLSMGLSCVRLQPS